MSILWLAAVILFCIKIAGLSATLTWGMVFAPVLIWFILVLLVAVLS
jgi:hypothetical protein